MRDVWTIFLETCHLSDQELKELKERLENGRIVSAELRRQMDEA